MFDLANRIKGKTLAVTFLTLIVAQGVAHADIFHNDDVITHGSHCIGFDCENGENFGFDTLRLKENNLRIHFEDTSNSPFPTNDWRIEINSSSSGGPSYFAIEDADTSRHVFEIREGAPEDAFFMHGSGNIGFGTNSPVVNLHTADGDTPTLRLEQDGTSGFAPQTWDIAGNETNFFIRDVTNGSRLPLRIRPGAPTSSIDISSDGNVGIGTTSPAEEIHIRSATPAFRLTDSDISQDWDFRMSSIGDFNITIPGSGGSEFTLKTGGGMRVGPAGFDAMEVFPGGNVVIAGTLTENSDVNAKRDIRAVNAQLVLAKLEKLPISTWNYKHDNPKVRHLGPMAQDFYTTFGLGAYETKISSLDMAGVALSASKALNERLHNEVKVRDEKIELLKAKLELNKSEVEALRQRLDKLETALQSAGITAADHDQIAAAK